MLSINYLFDIDLDDTSTMVKKGVRAVKNFGDRYLPSKERSEYIDNLRRHNDKTEEFLHGKGFSIQDNPEGASVATSEKRITVPKTGNIITKHYTGSNEIIRAHEYDEALGELKRREDPKLMNLRKASDDKMKQIDAEDAIKTKQIKDAEQKADAHISRSKVPILHAPRDNPGEVKKLVEKYKSDEFEKYQQHKNEIKKLDKDKDKLFDKYYRAVKDSHPLHSKNYADTGRHSADQVLRNEQNRIREASEKFGGFAPALKRIRHQTGEYDYINQENPKIDTKGDAPIEYFPAESRERSVKFRKSLLNKKPIGKVKNWLINKSIQY